MIPGTWFSVFAHVCQVRQNVGTRKCTVILWYLSNPVREHQ